MRKVSEESNPITNRHKQTWFFVRFSLIFCLLCSILSPLAFIFQSDSLHFAFFFDIFRTLHLHLPMYWHRALDYLWRFSVFGHHANIHPNRKTHTHTLTFIHIYLMQTLTYLNVFPMKSDFSAKNIWLQM